MKQIHQRKDLAYPVTDASLVPLLNQDILIGKVSRTHADEEPSLFSTAKRPISNTRHLFESRCCHWERSNISVNSYCYWRCQTFRLKLRAHDSLALLAVHWVAFTIIAFSVGLLLHSVSPPS
jgi:hypothetical protein